ncbi:MAG: hypothetical protein GY819_17385 [Planctomycetaceae bacterium]|nr:hypothetical protein [Planctomycetaceae bacterium]MCP4464569.1 hypothetical protein [Planctomycetaceae bacterium]MDG2105215.1 hypothetical protein [Pirellulaceae bacterium]
MTGVPLGDSLANLCSRYRSRYCDSTATGEELYSQIPQGLAGEICPFDDQKADASAWLDKLPVIVDFRRRLLGG